MKRMCLIAGVVALLAGCGKKGETVSAEGPRPTPAAAGKPGQVILPSDSPKLAQIKVLDVGEELVPLDEVDAPGKIEVNPNRVSNVTLPVTGKITSVLVKLGDPVTEGQPLVTIESPDADAAMAAYLQAGAGITQAKANLQKAQVDYDRVKDLFEHMAIAQKEVANAENNLTQAKAALEQAQAISKQAVRKLEILGLKKDEFAQKVTVRAPISGKILDIKVAAGEYRSDTNAPVLIIADLSTVWVASDVPENAIRLIQIGEHLEIQLEAYPNQKFNARVTRIADTVDPTTRTIKVRAEINNAGGRLRPEMFGRIRHVDSVQRLPVIPAGALVQGDGQNTVYLEQSRGTFQSTVVQVGNRVGDRVAILKGIKAGDRVVVDGVMLLKSY